MGESRRKKMDSKKVELKKEIAYTEYARLKRLAKNGIIEMIKTAIDYKWQLEINYNDTEKRFINPHCYFYNSKNENLLSGFQVKGFSESGNILNAWKTFKIEKITDCKISTPIVEFEIQSEFNPDYSGYGLSKWFVTESGIKVIYNS
tara:strand:+ start:191 stop:631 length:441 start_codon:yes stop_codon:yes gene_type:complete